MAGCRKLSLHQVSGLSVERPCWGWGRVRARYSLGLCHIPATDQVCGSGKMTYLP